MTRLKAVVACVVLAISVEVLNKAFHLMNLADDQKFYTGVGMLIIWFVVVTPIVVKSLLRQEKSNDKVDGGTQYQGGNTSADASTPRRVQQQDRPGDGGDRSGSVGNTAGSPGHRPQDG